MLTVPPTSAVNPSLSTTVDGMKTSRQINAAGS
jgi:hypothetical protein